MGRFELRTFDDIGSLAVHAADIFIEIALKAISEKGYFTVALSGGSTPKRLYETLASEEFKQKIDWEKTHLFWGDERCVCPESSESNYRGANASLITRIDIPAGNVHRIKAELEPKLAASLYEKEIIDFFSKYGADSLPSFDLVLLGLGADGHTLSLFPSTKALGESKRLVVENHVEKLGAWRITMTLPLVNSASNCVFLVSGKEKAGALKGLLAGKDIPAARIRPAKGRLLVLADKDAAGGL